MKVLIFHGYLLRGTGSNVYNASLAAALAGLGHEVHLVCQDHDPPELASPASPGSVTVHTPDIGGLLPVYVRDSYEGFEVKTFGELSDAELDAYLEHNVTAVRDLVDSLGGVDAALANHLVMGPVILARAGLEYAIKVHGSDLSYTVIPDLDRFGPYAEEACAGASGILVGSGHIAARLRRAVDDPATNAKVRLGPPGVDTDLFAPLAPADRAPRLHALARALRPSDDGAQAGGSPVSEKPDSRAGSRRTPASAGPDSTPTPASAGPDSTPAPASAGPDSKPASASAGPDQAGTTWDRDLDRAADAVAWFADADGFRAIFVGKLIVSKGVDLLLAAWPLVHAANPGARLLVVGFGAADEVLRGIWAALERGELGPLRELAARGRALEGGEEGRLELLTEFLEALPAGYDDAARAAAGSVAFSGRLEHEEVATPVAASDTLVFPSTFPEAFGMVAAEAAATGALPVSAHHSGAAEVSRELAAELPEDVARLVSFDLDGQVVEGISDRLVAWLALDAAERESVGESLRETVERLWSWQGVARTVLAASAGELEDLPVPVAP